MIDIDKDKDNAKAVIAALKEALDSMAEYIIRKKPEAERLRELLSSD